ncbi:NAD(P)-dependent oxidoreductase [Microbacterium esteraromaticum]|uniref:dTDP-4-dehydrorhamnose reductase n=1 Tax=Microbacterium esteraromaticum TaxID=57043 RepID=A0A7D8AHN5_9MICO|nr:NAD(P)-dependent oxidoreductase [Microbacterium esteraromaticum]QMU95969.1 NAD(P)-dependent oxidoreductase [Microbacterium esteraromaticum]
MKALVTGRRGFIGTALQHRLEELGWEVVGLEHDDARVDIRDAELVRSVIAHAAPDVVFHLAGVSGPMLLTDDPGAVVDINCVGTLNVIRAAADSGVARLIYGASVAAYATEGVGEPLADSVYGLTKKFGEMLADFYRATTPMQISSVRIGSTYGEGRETFNPLHEMVRQAVHGEPIRCNENQREPIVWVRDCAQLLAALATVEHLQPTYDAVTELPTHRQIAETIAAQLGGETETFGGEEVWYPRGFRLLGDAAGSLIGQPMRLPEAIIRIAGLVPEPSAATK